jgi:predicted N-formylglutamate amidohydrolase
MGEAAPVPAVTVLNADGASPYVLLCEHASNHIPRAYAGLGLAERDLQRHIAWDIGAADLARGLSRRLDAPLFLSGYSRLLIDCNRPPGAPTSIPVRSEATDIPGNLGLDPDERAWRESAYFAPFHAAVARLLDQRAAERRQTIVVGVHSFTPVFLGVARPWPVGVLYGRAEGFGRRLIERLGVELPDAPVGDNEPYRIEPEEHDYTVPVHGDARGLDAALIEVRQDLIATAAEAEAWAARLAPVLADVAREYAATEQPATSAPSSHTR